MRYRHGLLLLLALSSVQTATATRVSEEEFTCPIGGERFKTTVVLSGTSFGVNLDLKPYGMIVAPWPVPKCPANGFMMFKDDFKPDELKQLEAFVLSDRYQAAQKVESDHYLVAMLQRQLQASAETIAIALPKATWEVANDARYPRYAGEALDAFNTVIGDKSAKIEPGKMVTYILVAGELERRLGRFDAAQARLEALLQEDDVKGHPDERVVRQELALIAAKDTATHAVEQDKKH